ncbi:MAG: aspartate aminotransferase family protein, partial [Pseudomonadota bacterium]
MRTELPKTGTEWPLLAERMGDYAVNDVQWRDGKASVYIFHSGDDVMQVAHDAYGMFIAENGL